MPDDNLSLDVAGKVWPEAMTDEQRAEIRERLAYAFEILTNSEIQEVNPWLYIREYAGDVGALLADNDRLAKRNTAMREMLARFEPWLMTYHPDKGFICVSCSATGKTFGQVTHAETCYVRTIRALLEVSQ